MTQPFLKWVGGKSKLLKHITPFIPGEAINYHEPFVGGGSVLFHILDLVSKNKLKLSGKIYAYDLNDKLINVYTQVKNAPEELYKIISSYTEEYNSINSDVVNRKPTCLSEAKTSRESYYYFIRSKYNSLHGNTPEHAALFLFLNKTCFRGIYREGPNGFNVPFGNYKSKLRVVSKEDILDASKTLKDVTFIHSGFEKTFEFIKQGDFVYLDPPYAPETKTSFVGYTTSGFDIDKCADLFKSIKQLKDVKFIMSNSNTDTGRDAFTEFNTTEITARRAINSKNPASVTTELIVYN